MSLNEFKNFADDLANEARIIAKRYFRNSNAFSKQDTSPVTIADTEIEARIRSLIEINYPEHAIYGEELRESKGNSSYKWYIDPIDGTSAFITGKPTFTVLLCLTYNDEPILSVIDQPILGERYVALKNSQTTMNNEIIKPSSCIKLSEAKLSVTSPYLYDEADSVKLDLLRKQCNFQAYGGCFCGGDAYQYARLAAGDIDIVFESGLNLYDFYSLILIVQKAGGVITDWRGNKLNSKSEGRVLACSNPILHKEVLRVINQNKAETRH